MFLTVWRLEVQDQDTSRFSVWWDLLLGSWMVSSYCVLTWRKGQRSSLTWLGWLNHLPTPCAPHLEGWGTNIQSIEERYKWRSKGGLWGYGGFLKHQRCRDTWNWIWPPHGRRWPGWPGVCSQSGETPMAAHGKVCVKPVWRWHMSYEWGWRSSKPWHPRPQRSTPHLKCHFPSIKSSITHFLLDLSSSLILIWPTGWCCSQGLGLNYRIWELRQHHLQTQNTYKMGRYTLPGKPSSFNPQMQRCRKNSMKPNKV